MWVSSAGTDYAGDSVDFAGMLAEAALAGYDCASCNGGGNYLSCSI